MKRFVTVIMCALGFILLGIGIYQKSNSEILRYGYLEENYCKSFFIPNIDEMKKPDVLFEVLSKTAEETNCNIIKTSIVETDNNNYELVKYVLVENNKTKYIQNYSLSEGCMLDTNSTNSLESSQFVSTRCTDDLDQVGILKDDMLNMDVTMYPLSMMYQYMKADGLYYVDLDENMSEEYFINALHKNIKLYVGIDIDTSELEESDYTIGIPYMDLFLYYVIALLVMAIFLLLVFYYNLRNKKNIAIMKMFGVEWQAIWNYLYKTPVILFLIFVSISFMLCVLKEKSIVDALYIMRYVIALCPGIILVFFIAFYCSSKGLSFVSDLKGKRYTKGLMRFHIVINMLCIFFVIYAGAGIYENIKTLLREEKQYEAWDIADDYGTFYPFYIGDDQTSDEEYERDKKIAVDLYHYCNERGALYIDATDFEEKEADDNTETYKKSLKVNPNYLEAFAISDKNGNRIQINEDEENIILLVPESEKKNEDLITDYYLNEQESYEEIEREYYGGTNLGNQEVRIIWMDDNQRYFTFDSDDQSGNEMVNNSIVVVYTENNSYSCQRIGVQGNNSDPLKIKLMEDSKKTYEYYSEKLNELGLTDNLKAIVSINEQIQENMAVTRGNLVSAIKLFASLLLLIIYITYQTFYLMFETEKRKIVVLQMFGVGWLKYILKKSMPHFLSIICLSFCYGLFIKYGGLLYIMVMTILSIVLYALVLTLCLVKQMNTRRIDVLKGI